MPTTTFFRRGIPATACAALLVSAAIAQGQTASLPPAQSYSLPASIPSDTATARDSIRPRASSTEYSDAYSRRLEIHKIGSYVMLPMFAAEYVLGNRLLEGGVASWVSPTHTVIAGGLGILFAVNTVTGVWNLVESRHDPVGRPRRLIHSALMIASDAGFVWTGLIAGDAKHSQAGADRHRNVALGSMGLSTAGAVMMWLWQN